MLEIYYQKDGDTFVLVHDHGDGHKDQFWAGKEVAIGFTYDQDAERGIKYTTHRHGSPESVEKWAEKMRFALHRSRFTKEAQVGGENAAAILRSMQPHTISTDQWDLEDLNRILDTTGYLQVIVEKMGITFEA